MRSERLIRRSSLFCTALFMSFVPLSGAERFSRTVSAQPPSEGRSTETIAHPALRTELLEMMKEDQAARSASK